MFQPFPKRRKHNLIPRSAACLFNDFATGRGVINPYINLHIEITFKLPLDTYTEAKFRKVDQPRSICVTKCENKLNFLLKYLSYKISEHFSKILFSLQGTPVNFLKNR